VCEKQSNLSKDDAIIALERINSWVNNCDAKASVIIGFYGVILAILLTSDFVAYVSELIKNVLCDITFYDVVFVLLMTMSIIVFKYGLFKLIQVIIPRTNARIFQEDGLQTDSLIHFHSIAKNSKSFINYKEKIYSQNNKEQLDDILSQIYINSKICAKKFDNLKLGIKLSLYGIVGFGVMIIIGMIIY